jgi:hypothetical protein
MLATNCVYFPTPTREWSRVQNPCTYTDLNTPYNVNEDVINIERKYYKANILQYKANSCNFTKQQKYSQLAKGLGPARKKSYATQSQTYSNPNVTGLLRVNYVELPFPNTLTGRPNNISGPYQYNVANPNGCNNVSLQDGGNLVCGIYANPCTNEIIRKANKSDGDICNPSYFSDVPGKPVSLCWKNSLQTWTPKKRYYMSSGGTKFPQGYKNLNSAVKPI